MAWGGITAIPVLPGESEQEAIDRVFPEDDDETAGKVRMICGGRRRPEPRERTATQKGR